MWFRISRGHPHQYTVQLTTAEVVAVMPNRRRHARGCVHDLPARLSVTMWSGSEKVVATSLCREPGAPVASIGATSAVLNPGDAKIYRWEY